MAAADDNKNIRDAGAPDPPPPHDAPPSDVPAEESQPRRRRRAEFPKSQASKMWDAFGSPQSPVNEMPGGTYNSAGGRPQEVSWKDAFSFSNDHKGPKFWQTSCGRDSLLVGMAGGGAVGGVRFILKGLSQVWVSSNWAVGAFALIAGGMYTWCEQRRREEAKGIAAAVVGMKMLNEKKAREKAEAAAAAEAQARAEEERRKAQKWWKPW